MPDPLAFFLTWTAYGTWLPGDERGWVQRGKGFQLPDFERYCRALERLAERPCTLDAEHRAVVESTIKSHCEIRGWTLFAVNCRTRHVHVVVAANRDPEIVREQFKAWCTRRLKELEIARGVPEAELRQNWWTERGSIRRIDDEQSLDAAIQYVLEGQ